MQKKIPSMVALVSLGCPKNFVDTEIAAGSIFGNGLGVTGDEDDADIMLINTCAFIDSARADSFAAIERAVKWKKKRAGRKLVVAGCLIGWKKIEEVKARYPEVDLWTSVDSVANLGTLLSKLDREEVAEAPAFERPHYLYDEKTARVQLTPPHYAYLKIADGCDNCCAYCSIPLLRGGLRSRTEKSVISEARQLLDNGVRELILIAQDTGAFRRETGETDALAKLLGKLDALPGDYRLRLMYLHPSTVTDRLVGTLADCSHLARCIEMPIQHISDRILLSMGRHVGEKATREAVRRIREEASCAIRTTFLVGFPGETPEDFNLLKDFVAEQKFERMGAFPYSPEEDTRAAGFPDPVPGKVAQARYKKLMEIQKEISWTANQNLIGRKVEAIVDALDKRGKAFGRTMLDAPEIDNGLILRHCPKGLKPGDFVEAVVASADAYDVEADVVVG